MIGCAFTAQLEDNLSVEEKKKILDQVKGIKGVFSAAFADAAKPGNVISIHAGSGAHQEAVRKIPGVKSTKPDSRMRM